MQYRTEHEYQCEGGILNVWRGSSTWSISKYHTKWSTPTFPAT